MSKCGIAFAVLFAFLGSVYGVSSFALTLDLPCVPDNPDPTDPATLLPLCKDLKPRLKTALGGYIKKYSDAYYNGTTELADPSKNKAPAQDFGWPVCDILPSLFNNCLGEPSAANKNHNGVSCEDLLYIGVNINVGIASYGQSKTSWWPTSKWVTTTVNIDGSATKGAREHAWVRGAWLHILAFKWKEVENEIITTQKLSISPSCYAAANDLISNIVPDTKKFSIGIAAEFPPGVKTSDIYNACTDPGSALWNPNVALPHPDLGKMRQRLQYVCSSFAGIERALGSIALCEVMDRANVTYQKEFFDSPNPGGSYIGDSIQPISDACASECKSQCDPSCWQDLWFIVYNNVSALCSKCATDCANTCYNTRLRDRITTKLKPFSVKAAAPEGCPNVQ